MKTIIHAFLLLGLAALATTSSRAWAINYNVCVQYGILFEDADSDVGDDYITSNADRPARGAHIEVTRTSTGVVVADDFADQSGSAVGCLTGVVATAGVSYTVKVYTEAELGQNVVEVFVDDTDTYRYSQAWTWVPSHTTSTITFSTVVGDAWNIAAAAGFAASRNDGGQSGERYRWYTEECPGSSQSCVVEKTGGGYPSWVAYMCKAADCPQLEPAYKKYLIAHQMGHLVSIFANDDLRAAIDPNAPDDTNCDGNGGTGHHLHSKEYQSSAAYEGIAHIWAAMAFNITTSGADCGFEHYVDVNWNNDNNINTTSIFNCDGDLPDAIDGGDYLGDQCTGSLNGRATEVDWLRFWWDLMTDASLTDDAVYAIWAGASPDDWDPDGTTGADHPPNRLIGSAVPTYLSSGTWGSASTANGVQR